jgi:hypothetical protein
VIRGAQALLDGLVDSLPAARLLLLVNYRPEYRHAWGGKTYYRQLRIDPLPSDNADELLDALLGADAALDPLKRLLVGGRKRILCSSKRAFGPWLIPGSWLARAAHAGSPGPSRI